jgi:hypothetical protein
MAIGSMSAPAVASRHGFEYRRRSWGETESLDTIQPGEARDQAARVRGWYSSVFAVPTP